MRNINKDRFGIVCQIEGDGTLGGGDSAFAMGHYVYHKSLKRRDFDYRLFFEKGFGGYLRHPDPDNYMKPRYPGTDKYWGSIYKNPWRGCISRDQMTGILAALIAQKDYVGLLRLGCVWACSLFLFSTNSIPTSGDWKNDKDSPWQPPNITGPNLWGMYLRGFGYLSWIFWPVLNFIDIHILIDTIRHWKDEDTDKANFLARLHVARFRVPTITSFIAWKLLDKEKLKADMEDYWSGWRSNPGMADLLNGSLDND